MQGYNDFQVYGQYRMEQERRRVAAERLEGAICCYLGTMGKIRATIGRLLGSDSARESRLATDYGAPNGMNGDLPEASSVDELGAVCCASSR